MFTNKLLEYFICEVIRMIASCVDEQDNILWTA